MLLVDHMVSIICTHEELFEDAQSCAEGLGIKVNQPSVSPYVLNFSVNGVALDLTTNSKKESVEVNFCTGSQAHRRLYGGGKSQMVAKAVGISTKNKPTIFDGTAGLGKDAFVLASLGCEVTMMERSPISFALLKDGLRRGRLLSEERDPDVYQILNRMRLLSGDSIEYLTSMDECVADVIYLDPMFPLGQKKAAVKKDMQAFHNVVGQDLDGENLFLSAEHKARYRLVVKRSRKAPKISSALPTYSLDGKSSRFDIYAYKTMSVKEK